jgi:DNA-binding transcriptional LysR family regulator
MTLRELRYFVALADERSVTAAAARVGLSQPAMSTSLGNLERTMGVSLFVRLRGQGVSLTQEGQLLAQEARLLLAHAEEVRTRIASVSGVATGPISIGSLVTVAPLVVPKMVRAFGSDHPGVTVQMRTGPQDQLLSWLRSGEIHLAITYDLDLDASIEFHHLSDALPRVVLPADHRLAGRRTLRLGDLTDEPYVLLDLPLSREYFTSLFLASNVPYQPALRVEDLTLVRSLVANGFGYSLVNQLPATTQAQDGGELAYVRLDTPVPPLRLGVALLAASTQPRAVKAFVEFAAQHAPRLAK